MNEKYLLSIMHLRLCLEASGAQIVYFKLINTDDD